jgi:pyruvate,orthophosphate dikinase
MNGKIFTYGFGDNVGNKDSKDLLGGKGANLAEMSTLGLPVPYGITITTDVCNHYLSLTPHDRAKFLDTYYADEVRPVLDQLEDLIGYAPLYSVRSGARDSMPGMMDTLLNIGLTRANRHEWSQRLGLSSVGSSVMLDCRRRQLEMYGDTVEGKAAQIKSLRNKIGMYKYGLAEAPGADFMNSPQHVDKYISKLEDLVFLPRSVDAQIIRSIRAVFESWHSQRAQDYRKMYGISDDLGTAVNIQMMVFGNIGNKSASGVYFTRNAATGEHEPYGDMVINGQGEDVVAGTHDTLPVTTLKTLLPECYDQLIAIGNELEHVYADMVDTEFTIENGKLYMLQVRVGKREAKAAFRIAHDMVFDGLIDKETAVSRVTAKQYRALRQIRIDLDEIPTPDYTGIAAGGSLVVGTPVATAAEAIAAQCDVILTTDETNPDDFAGMAASVGILTRTGGATSHAAVVGRSLEKHCVVGCTSLPETDALPDLITVDGSTGRVWLQALPLTTGEVDKYAATLLEWGIQLKQDTLVLKGTVDDRDCDNMYINLGDSSMNAVNEFLTDIGNRESVERVFVDITAPGGDMIDADDLLWNLTGEVVNPSDTLSQDRVRDFEALGGVGSAKKKVVLIVPRTTSDDTVAELRAAGWRVVGKVKDIETLLDTDGIIEIDPEFESNIGGSTVAEKLFALMKDAGKEIEIAPTPVSANRLVFEVFNS